MTLKRRVQSAAECWRADLVLIEHAGSGISLVQWLRQEDARGDRFRFYKPRQDKVTRLEAQTARRETGRYLIPTNAPWLDEFRRELKTFRWASTTTRSTA